MKDDRSHPTIKGILEHHPSLTPKGRVIRRYILANPRRAVFMTTRELAETCGVSEATVVRFVNQLGFKGFADFRQALRDFVDTDLTLLDRTDLRDMKGPDIDRLRRVVLEEIDNLKHFVENVDTHLLQQVISAIQESANVIVTGSRLSYTFAYYFGWSLSKIRRNVSILCGSDSTAIDWLTIAPVKSLVILIATTRYPNELIRLGKVARRLDHRLLVIADSALCPIVQFADLALLAPTRHIPFIGNPTTIACIVNYVVSELASRNNVAIEAHQKRLEQVYLENDVLFNITRG